MLETTFNFAIVIGGAVLLFQFVMMLLGLGHHGHDIGGLHHGDVSSGGGLHHGGMSAGGDYHDGDFSGSHDSSWHHDAAGDGSHHVGNWFYEIISIRTLSAALTFYGLAGKTAQAWGYSPRASFAIACAVGAGAMYGVYWLYKQVYKLQHTGTENIRNAIGTSAVVYIPIPAKRAGAGKVTFRLQNRLVEYLAVTEDENRLATGEKVVVVGIVSSDTVRVARATVPEGNLVTSTSGT
jgi:hypothetical protein